MLDFENSEPSDSEPLVEERPLAIVNAFSKLKISTRSYEIIGDESPPSEEPFRLSFDSDNSVISNLLTDEFDEGKLKAELSYIVTNYRSDKMPRGLSTPTSQAYSELLKAFASKNCSLALLNEKINHFNVEFIKAFIVYSDAKSLHLTLKQNPLTRLPIEIFNDGLLASFFSDLEYLNIENACLDSLPECIKGLANLKSLRVHNCQLQHVAPAVATLTKLEYLDLSQNLLTHLPSTFDLLNADCVVYLCKNRLTAIPPNLEGSLRAGLNQPISISECFASQQKQKAGCFIQ